MGQILKVKALNPLQELAKQLIAVAGKSQKDVANQLGVSEKTIGSWIVKFKWTKNDIMSVKRREAKKLILKQGFSQKEAAQMVGVSEKTMGIWAKKYQWLANVKFVMPTYGQAAFLFGELNSFINIKERNLPLAKELNKSATAFLEHLQQVSEFVKKYTDETGDLKDSE